MLHDENNEHACTGCTACELACPNATIKIITKFDITPEGKKKKALDTFVYHLGTMHNVQFVYRGLSRPMLLKWRKHLNTVCLTEIS